VTAVSGSVTVGGTAYPCSAPVTLPGGLPAGVTLRPIDGGPTYYADHGFTYAASAAFNGMGWDDPRFFPIGSDYCFYPSNSTATFKALGLNFVHRITTDEALSALASAGIWVLAAANSYSGTPGAETVGWHLEEPGTWSDIPGQCPTFSGSLNGRFLQCSFTFNQLIYGPPGNTPGGTVQAMMSDTFSTVDGPRHIDIPGDDIYWCASSEIAHPYSGPWAGGQIYGTATLTQDQCRRGCRYGDMVDAMRAWMVTYPAPVGAPYIETEDGLATATTGTVTRILPAELNAAAWSTLIHGARWLLYFGTTSNYGSVPRFGFSQTPLPAQAGGLPAQTISVFTQGVNTNTLVRKLAPVLNSPKALGYFTVTPPPVKLSSSAVDSGIDACAKYVTNGGPAGLGTGGPSWAGNGFYLIAGTRLGAASTNIAATFTTADGYSGPVQAINADGGSASYGTTYALTASNGVFTDTFASGHSIRIYYIP
jgi:hypothetical protein